LGCDRPRSIPEVADRRARSGITPSTLVGFCRIVTQTEDIRRGYLAEVERFNNEFERIRQRDNRERILVDTSREIAEVLVGYLNARTAMKRFP
jgi:hypothetical protein